MAFDEDGRLWVVEMIDYPYDEREGVPPEVASGCSRMRTATAVSSGAPSSPTAPLAHGPCLWDGGVFVASAPDILYLKDTDGDHQADHKEVVFTGFRRNNVQALLSNLTVGPGQLVHWVVRPGRRAGPLPPQPNSPIAVDARHFRSRPTGEIEALSGDGRYSNTSDDFGHRSCSATTSPVRHVVVEDRYCHGTHTCPSSAAVNPAAAEGSSARYIRQLAGALRGSWVRPISCRNARRASSGSIERAARDRLFHRRHGPTDLPRKRARRVCYGQYSSASAG